MKRKFETKLPSLVSDAINSQRGRDQKGDHAITALDELSVKLSEIFKREIPAFNVDQFLTDSGV